MKNQTLFSSKDKSKKLKCRLLQFLFGAFKVKSCHCLRVYFSCLRTGKQIDDGWMTCDFTSFLTLFQSYLDDVWMIMKGCVQWNSVYG